MRQARRKFGAIENEKGRYLRKIGDLEMQLDLADAFNPLRSA